MPVRLVQVLGLQAAAAAAHIKNFDDKKEVGAKPGAAEAHWFECLADYPATGQRIRWAGEDWEVEVEVWVGQE